MTDTLLMTCYATPMSSRLLAYAAPQPAVMTRAAARAAVEGARLSWAAFVADEGDYPIYPGAIVFAWCSAKVY